MEGAMRRTPPGSFPPSAGIIRTGHADSGTDHENGRINLPTGVEPRVRYGLTRWLFGLLVGLVLWPLAAAAGTLRDDYPPVPDDAALAIETRQFRAMTAGEHPLARMERLAHDYVYAESRKGYGDAELLRRMKADGLTLMETYQADDGTAAMVVRHDGTAPPEYTLAFRGSDDRMDYALNALEVLKNKPVGYTQYQAHRGVLAAWAERYGAGGGLTVTGHSRGGGLAALFTASHADKVDSLTMFQAPGQTLEDHKRFRQTLGDGTWPRTTLVVAASDVVQAAGQRHLGQAEVIVALSNDMAADTGFGHTRFLLQNAWTVGWGGKLYRTPGDGLLRTVLDYDAYARRRVHAAVNADRAQEEVDVLAELYHELFPHSPAAAWVEGVRLTSDAAEIAAGAQAAFRYFKDRIRRDNGLTLDAASERSLDAMADQFHHILPPRYWSFEDQFLSIFEAMIEADLKALQSGARTESRFFLDAATRHFLHRHGTKAYLVALRSVYRGNYLDITPSLGAAATMEFLLLFPDRFAAGKGEPRADPRSVLLTHYYEVQKQCLTVLRQMMAAADMMILAGVAETAANLEAFGEALTRYMLDAAERQQVNAAAKRGDGRPQPDEASRQAAQVAVAASDARASQALPDAGALLRAYESLHEDLFIGALSYPGFQHQQQVWASMAETFWRNVSRGLTAKSRRGRQVARAKAAFDRAVGDIDASFRVQAESALARLDLLYRRYRQAGRQSPMEDLDEDIAATRATLREIGASGVLWMGEDGTVTDSSEAAIAARAVAPARMGPWMGTLVVRNEAAATSALDLRARLAPRLTDYRARIQREQDYVLAVLDFYGIERTRRQGVAAFHAASGGVSYPKAEALRAQAYRDRLTPLSDRFMTLLRLYETAARVTAIGHRYRSVGQDRDRDKTYANDAFRRLVTAEADLLRRYDRIAAGIHAGSSGAPATPPDDGHHVPTDYAGPALRLAEHPICIAVYACDGRLTMTLYLDLVGERLRIWRLPAGDTKRAAAGSAAALGDLHASAPAHRDLLAQLPGAEQEIRRKHEAVEPLYREFHALASWRKSLETAFAQQVRAKPVLARAMPGKAPLTRWWADTAIPVPPKVGATGPVPARLALKAESLVAWPALNADYTVLDGRLAAVETHIRPQAEALIEAISAEDARVRADVQAHLDAAWVLIEARRQQPMTGARLAAWSDAVNRHLNHVLAMHHHVADYAPFKADFGPAVDDLRLALAAFEIGSDVGGQDAQGSGTLSFSIEADPGMDLTALDIRVVTTDGHEAARGPGPHDLPAGRYQVRAEAPGLETSVAPQGAMLHASEGLEVQIFVWQDDEDEDEFNPYAGTVADLCASDRDFARSLFHAVLGREPSKQDLDALSASLKAGHRRADVLTELLLGEAYQARGLGGAGFYADAIQAVLGRNPTADEMAAWPRTRRAVIARDLLASVEHRQATAACAALWGRAAAADPDGSDGDETEQDRETPTTEDLYQAYIEAYNAFTSLMAAGRGDTPEGHAAYEAYRAARKTYDEASSSDRTPPRGADTDDP